MALWIIAGFFAVMATPLLLIAQRVFARDRLILQWPRAPGVVTSAQLEKRTQTARDDENWGKEYTSYLPVIRYTYEVAGQTYPGDHIGREPVWIDKKPAQELVERYAPGKAIEVLYDPSNPATAYLEIKRSTGAMILAVWGGVFMLVSAILVVVALVV